MRRTAYRPFILIALLLFGLLTLPYPTIEQTRSASVGMLSPFWRWLGNSKALILTPFSHINLWFSSAPRQRLESLEAELQHLQLENRMLALRMEEIVAGAQQDSVVAHGRFDSEIADQIVSARVVYRNPGSWGSSLWIDVGEERNKQLPHPVIAKNSPVVYGDAVVGVIDYVGSRRSRVRLITDSGLRPSVRALRTHQDGSQELLAKGELQGQSQALWRQASQELDGIGFNYDTADNEGPARDLRSGDVIREGDLLITTGMDGVFPKGLSVAKVTQVKLLREGAYFYDLKATPTAPNLSDLSILFVLPSLGLPTPE